MPSSLSNFENYIFDLDGTLVNSSADVLESLALALKESGLPFDPSLLVPTLIGPPIRDILINVLLSPASEEELGNAIQLFRAAYDTNPHAYSYLYEGVSEWLKTLLQKGKRLFIATNKPALPTQHLLVQFRLTRFESVLTIDSIEGRRLSKYHMLEQILTEHQLNRESTLMVGDTCSDMAAAQQAGIASCAVLWGYEANKESLKQEASFVLEDANALKKGLLV